MSTSSGELVTDTALIVAAAGSSRRFQLGNKLFAMLDGYPVFVHCLRTLSKVLAPGRIILAVNPSDEALFRETANRYLPDIPLIFVHGGETRCRSVRNALAAATKLSGIRFAAVHDAARPFLSGSLFLDCLDAARKHGGALLCHRISDTVKRIAPDGTSAETIDREPLRGAETPQIFPLEPLCRAYDCALASGGSFTDDAQIMERFSSIRPYLLEHRENNRKITYAEDLRNDRSYSE